MRESLNLDLLLTATATPVIGLLFSRGRNDQKMTPVLFSSFILSYLRTRAHVMSIDVTSCDVDELRAQLSMSFLGESQWIWLNNVFEMESKKKRALFDALFAYQGPHRVIFFDEQGTWKGPEILIPATVDKKGYETIQALCGASKGNEGFARALFTQRKTVPLESACLMMSYQQVVGSGMVDAFMKQCLSLVVASEHSLFTLSQYFFAKKTREFFELWKELKQNYPPVFWTVFWEDQLWRAYHVVLFHRVKQFDAAKKMSSRLPFSFIQKEWSLYKGDELYRAHQALYDLDWRLKNGANEVAVELFYTDFFQNT